jgi:hypothetical protein
VYINRTATLATLTPDLSTCGFTPVSSSSWSLPWSPFVLGSNTISIGAYYLIYHYYIAKREDVHQISRVVFFGTVISFFLQILGIVGEVLLTYDIYQTLSSIQELSNLTFYLILLLILVLISIVIMVVLSDLLVFCSLYNGHDTEGFEKSGFNSPRKARPGRSADWPLPRTVNRMNCLRIN